MFLDQNYLGFVTFRTQIRQSTRWLTLRL